MKVTQISILLLSFLLINLFEARKPIRSQHPYRRLSKNSERRLMGFGTDETTDDIEEASEHSHMVMMMNMMEKNSQISNIMKNVKRFSSSLDDLAESVNTQIVQLASVANSNLGKNLYLSKI